MNLGALIANSLWSVSNLRAHRRFCRALREPHATQQRKLRACLDRNKHTAFGKAHGFASIRNYDDFARRVPLADYDDFEPWIVRVRLGEHDVLTSEPVSHFIPTSGSTGARKLIPFTAGLQREFNAAIGPWMIDLQRQFPGLIGGPAYWSVTPPLYEAETEESAVPIGFDSDTAYLGGVRRRLVEAVMAVPQTVQHAKSLEDFRFQTLLHLLRCRDLRLISVWHPSFLTLLLDSLPEFWKSLTGALGSRPELRDADPTNPESLWPELRVISCWADGAAELAAADLRKRFPSVLIQPKGLLATEAVVTLPFHGQYPLAVESHFFEFIDGAGRTLRTDELRDGGEYELAVTTNGGLYRYRLGDRVRVSGCLHDTPSLRFLGRAGNVSDLFGEKLSEEFVVDALSETFGNESPRFALLAPDKDDDGCRYTLYVEGRVRPDWLARLEIALSRNPHYAHCRKLEQLLPLRMFVIDGNGYGQFVKQHLANGARVGDVKPAALERGSGWSRVFCGFYAEADSRTVVR